MPEMELKPNMGSDRAWVWSTLADFADGECKEELLAIRFANAESKFKEKNNASNVVMALSVACVLFVCSTWFCF